MAEYARYYGGLPAPDSPWPLFRALVARVSRFEARVQLSLMTSVASAIGSAFGGSDAQAQLAREALFRRAYPVRDDESAFFDNLWHQEVQA